MTANHQSFREISMIRFPAAPGVMLQIFVIALAYAGVNVEKAMIAATTSTASVKPSAPSRTFSSPSSIRSSIWAAKRISANIPIIANFSG